jgi:hypothetical protein
MSDRITIPVKKVNGEPWGELSFFGSAHEFCCEKGELKDNQYSFSGGHRVRLFHLRKNVHWKIPVGQNLDVSAVPPATAPRRQGR